MTPHYSASPGQRCCLCGEQVESYVMQNKRAVCDCCVHAEEEQSSPGSMLGAVLLWMACVAVGTAVALFLKEW